METESRPAVLRPLPYHRALRAHLEKHLPEVWEWFASDKFRESDAEDVRLALLKSTYRLERESHGDLFTLADRALKELGLDVPVSLYQSQSEEDRNAYLAYLPGEPHVVFCGPVLSLLEPEETAALLGHELAHFHLWDSWNREYFAAHKVTTALACDPQADSSHEETARLDRLYTEILADRGGLTVTDDLHATVRMLVKVVTGLDRVSAASYLDQAEEVFARDAAARDGTGAEGLSHPEVYIRARALRLWSEQGEAAEVEIARTIQGQAVLDRLDLLSQEKWSGLTRRLIRLLLAHRWWQTDAVLAHARHFFDDLALPGEDHRDESLFAELEVADPGLRDYVGYVILDFIALARELEEAPIAAGFAVADRLGLGDRLKELVAKELRVPKRELARIRDGASDILAQL